MVIALSMLSQSSNAYLMHGNWSQWRSKCLIHSLSMDNVATEVPDLAQ